MDLVEFPLFYKGGSLYGFLFIVLHTKPLLKKVIILKECNSLLLQTKTILKVVSPVSVYFLNKYTTKYDFDYKYDYEFGLLPPVAVCIYTPLLIPIQWGG